MAAKIAVLLFALLGLLPVMGCQRPAPPAGGAAEKPRAEAELSRTSITRDAKASLGIETKPVRSEQVQDQRLLTGWVMPRPGNEVTVTAPVSGYVRAPAAPATLPAAGLAVAQGQELFRLEPVLAPLEQTQLSVLVRTIESDLTKARENVDKDRKELQRIEELVKQKLRGERDLELAQTQLRVSSADLAAAEEKLKLISPSHDKGTMRWPAQSLTAPRAGIALAVTVSPGQFVTAAAPLATVADMARPWVRVPIAEYDLPHVDRGRAAQVKIIPEAPGRREGKAAPVYVTGEPVGLVPQVDLIKHTADLIYELKTPTEHATLAKDQMVLVSVPIGSRSQQPVVPYSAVIFDAYGGTWVYVDRTKAADAGSCDYERVRVELGVPIGTDVAVHGALKANDPVVSEGAAALFSREFHRPPVTPPAAPKGKL
jgi:membrane fusion protein, heavy metal efflux system